MRYAYNIYIYIITSPFFWCQSPPLYMQLTIWYALNWLPMNVHGLICFELATYECTKFDTFWTDCLWMHMVHLWSFERCSTPGIKTDFHHGSCHLWCPHYSLLHESITVSGSGLKLLLPSRLSGHSMLDPSHLAVSNKYYSSGVTKWLEGCFIIWNSARLYAKWHLLLPYFHHSS